MSIRSRSLCSSGTVDRPGPDRVPDGRRNRHPLLEPLAATPEIAPSLRLNARVLGVARAGIDKLKDAGRDEAPFELLVDEAGVERRYVASAVIDASGTWTRPNPLGAGLPASGEAALRERIAYGIPDVLGEARARFAGKRVVVVGSGHSALNAILDLVALRESEPATQIVWAMRGGAPGRKYGGGGADQLPARGALGAAVRALVEDGSVALAAGFQTRSVSRSAAARSCSPTVSARSSPTRSSPPPAFARTSSCCASCGSTLMTASKPPVRSRP